MRNDSGRIIILDGTSDKILDKKQAKSGESSRLAWRALEVRDHFRHLWKREQHIIRYVWPLFNSLVSDGGAENACPLDVLFMGRFFLFSNSL